MSLHQPSLLEWEPPRARVTDPQTAHMAAEKASLGASRGRLLVLQHLSVRPLSDFELADLTGWQATSIGKRRHECMRAGYVERALDGRGEEVRRETPSKSMALVWAITESGRAFYAQHGAA